MGNVIVTEFITLDGRMEAPEKWSLEYWDDEKIAVFKDAELKSADALLLGRVTYDGFAAAWPGRTDDTGYADKINAMPKHVVTSKGETTWQNTTVINSDIKVAVQTLKSTYKGDIVVFGSAQLTQTLLADELVDELRLLTYPVVIGEGKRLFADSYAGKYTLLETKQYASGAVLLRYQTA